MPVPFLPVHLQSSMKNTIMFNQLTAIIYCWVRIIASYFLNESCMVNTVLTLMPVQDLGYMWSGESKHCLWLLCK